MLTDEQLMEQLKSGQMDAIDELYRRYAGKLYAFCYSITRSESSEDLVQDVFMRVITAARNFNPKKALFRTWMFRIARNHCVDFMRRKSKVGFVPIEKLVDPDDGAPDDVDVEASAIQAATIEAVRDCIDELDDEQEKQAIVLYYIAEKVYREIGEIIGKSTSMARNRVESAREKIRRCLERKGVNSFPENSAKIDR